MVGFGSGAKNAGLFAIDEEDEDFRDSFVPASKGNMFGQANKGGKAMKNFLDEEEEEEEFVPKAR